MDCAGDIDFVIDVHLNDVFTSFEIDCGYKLFYEETNSSNAYNGCRSKGFSCRG